MCRIQAFGEGEQKDVRYWQKGDPSHDGQWLWFRYRESNPALFGALIQGRVKANDVSRYTIPDIDEWIEIYNYISFQPKIELSGSKNEQLDSLMTYQLSRHSTASEESKRAWMPNTLSWTCYFTNAKSKEWFKHMLRTDFQATHRHPVLRIGQHRFLQPQIYWLDCMIGPNSAGFDNLVETSWLLSFANRIDLNIDRLQSIPLQARRLGRCRLTLWSLFRFPIRSRSIL